MMSDMTLVQDFKSTYEIRQGEKRGSDEHYYDIMRPINSIFPPSNCSKAFLSAWRDAVAGLTMEEQMRLEAKFFSITAERGYALINYEFVEESEYGKMLETAKEYLTCLDEDITENCEEFGMISYLMDVFEERLEYYGVI